jgi:hypothetical protein
MATAKISGLPAATTPLAGTELLELVQSGSSVRVTADALTARSYINASSAVDQTGSTTVGTAITMDTGLTGVGISVVSGSRITFANAGTYMLTPSIQFANSASTNYTATVWFRKNGANIANSASVVSVPKVADGGLTLLTVAVIETVTAGQYIEMVWLTQNTAVTVDATAAGAVAPAVPSVLVPVVRIA